MKTKIFLLYLFVFFIITVQQIFAQYPYSILIDPGHGSSNTGTSGWDGVYEKIVTLQLAEQLRNSLIFGVDQSGGILWGTDIYMTRIGDDFVFNTDRAKMAKGEIADAYWGVRPTRSDLTTYGVDIFLSIHINSDPYNSSTTGTSAMIWDATEWNMNPNPFSNDFSFAETLVSEYVNQTSFVYSNAKIAYGSQTGVVGRNGNITVLDDTTYKKC